MQRGVSQREQADAQLLPLLRQGHAEGRGNYGRPRLLAWLAQRGIRCGHTRAWRLSDHGIACPAFFNSTTPILCVGLDVAKLSLELHLAGHAHALANTAKGHAQLLKHLRAHPNAHVVCEATGGYEQSVVRALHAAGIPVSILEAGRVRHFARAQGQRAKTDPIDAAVLADYGRAFAPVATLPASPPQRQLADLTQRRRQLVTLLVIEGNHVEHYADPFRRRQARQLAKVLEKQITECEPAIAQLIAADTQLAHKAERLKAIPGVGPIIAATLLAEMPELGRLTKQTAAALAGVAPYNRASGSQKNIRSISGGRRVVRAALYMAALSAVRHDRILKKFYQRLRAADKKTLVALTACMRKLIILMNQLLKMITFSLPPNTVAKSATSGQLPSSRYSRAGQCAAAQAAGEGGNVGLCAADVPATFIKGAAFRVLLAGDDGKVFRGHDDTFFFEADFRPVKPVHVQSEVVNPAQEHVCCDGAGFQHFQEVCRLRFQNRQIADEVKGGLLHRPFVAERRELDAGVREQERPHRRGGSQQLSHGAERGMKPRSAVPRQQLSLTNNWLAHGSITDIGEDWGGDYIIPRRFYHGG